MGSRGRGGGHDLLEVREEEEDGVIQALSESMGRRAALHNHGMAPPARRGGNAG